MIKTVAFATISAWGSADRPILRTDHTFDAGCIFSLEVEGGSSYVDRRGSVRDDDSGRACIMVI